MDMEQLDAAFAAIKKQMAEQKQRDQAELEEVKKRDMAELADKRDKMMAQVEEERARLKTEWDWVSLATGKSSRSPCDPDEVDPYYYPQDLSFFLGFPCGFYSFFYFVSVCCFLTNFYVR
ncbi:hypothetical protein Pelo_1677 [Pelomyxa schiedti]|nr:hypothetical protein Pelo_1677 [Pelomyxa schiedti]